MCFTEIFRRFVVVRKLIVYLLTYINRLFRSRVKVCNLTDISILNYKLIKEYDDRRLLINGNVVVPNASSIWNIFQTKKYPIF